jgi:hypothetical protein
MSRKNIYLVLAVLGLVLPYVFFFQFFTANGLRVGLLVQQALINPVTIAFTVDLVLSIIVFWIYLLSEADKIQMKNAWLYLLASLTIGLSFALPLFLYFRERQLENR